MSQQIDNDPLDDAFRRADPYAAEDDPAASLARIRARVDAEIEMADRPQIGPRGWQRWVPSGAAALAVLVLAVLVLPRLVGPAGESQPPARTAALVAVASALPTSSPVSSGGASLPPPVIFPPGAGSCVELYSLATLANRSIAFDGTVSTIQGNDVDFTINTSYRGVTGSSVTLSAEGMTGTSVTSAGGPTLRVGDRFLVAGEDHFAWGCGFTQPYDPAVAAQWAAALSR